jgi:AAA family ATP:ADP antiporter
MPSLKSRGEESRREKAMSASKPLHEQGEEEDDLEYPSDVGLLSKKRMRFAHESSVPRHDWLRPYWLGLGLFLVLFPFWLLDSLKDPMLGALTDNNLERHQPPAKLFSVCTTLALVCFLEYFSHEKKRQKRLEKIKSDKEVLDGGGEWKRMSMDADGEVLVDDELSDDAVPSSIFALIGLPYCLAFGIIAYLLQFNPNVALTDSPAVTFNANPQRLWGTLGYFFFAAIESYGSLSVAAFWSYANSTLSLEDAERFYGPIIAIAQLGAALGSTMVTTTRWANITLVVLACLIIILHIIVMTAYCRHFPPSNRQIQREEVIVAPTEEPTLWSGVYLILKHNYVLLIFGASSLYEISLTCLNYQMTILGSRRFEETGDEDMSFPQFMGHYGQLVNISSLFLSALVFPLLMRRVGLKSTLRIFPTLLLIVNVVAFGALPGNLTVLFFSMSILKAMMYSIHDPSTELLYLPTSNAIKFKSKFWIDVVGARVAKAVGSSINTLAGSVDRSILVAGAPSLLTAAALWIVSYYVGEVFEDLVAGKIVVGVDDPVLITDELDYDHLEMEASENDLEPLFEHPAAPIVELELSNRTSATRGW